MQCRVCDMSDTYDLLDHHGTRWFRCLGCGSDSSDMEFANLTYGEREARFVLDQLGSMEAAIHAMTTNLEWFDRYRHVAPERTFLDVGTNEGAAMVAMRQRGWVVAAFDVNPKSPATVVKEQFRADLFDRRFGAVLCREVIEHVPDWGYMLEQIMQASLPGALVQIQTPRPIHNKECSAFDCVYAPAHLQVFSPVFLRMKLERVGLKILERLIWDGGQAWMCVR